MASYVLPTSRDIYLEVNGKKLAIVESYKASAAKESKSIEAFGEAEPVATIGGRVKYQIELSRVYATKEALGDGIDFYELSGFNLVIVKPDCRICYSGCEWSDINEAANLNDTVLESLRIVAAKRLCIR